MVKVFKVSSQDVVQQLRLLLRTFQLVPWVSRFKGFFALFLTGKKCEDPAHPGVGTGCAVELMDAMSLAGLEHGGQGDRHGCGSSLVAERQEWSCLVRASSALPSDALAGAPAGAGCARVPPVSRRG